MNLADLISINLKNGLTARQEEAHATIQLLNGGEFDILKERKLKTGAVVEIEIYDKGNPSVGHAELIARGTHPSYKASRGGEIWTVRRYSDNAIIYAEVHARDIVIQ